MISRKFDFCQTPAIVGKRAKNATANNENGNTSSIDLLTDVGGVVSAGDGEVDDVLVGGGEQGDDEQAKHQQHPSQAGAWLVPHATSSSGDNVAHVAHTGKHLRRQ